MTVVAITGGSGTVGRAMAQPLLARGLASVPLGREDCDVTNRAALREALKHIRPAAVVHLAAMTNVDECELQRDLAFATNVMGTEHVATACRETDAFLVYVSTGGVFAGLGTDGPFHELHAPRPANWYAATKLAGEKAAGGAPKHAVIRAGWVVGAGASDPKFVGQMLRLMRARPKVKAVGDRFGSLTFAAELASFIGGIIEGEAEGCWHFASPGVVSRYDVALEIAHTLGLQVEIERVGQAMFPSAAPRGRSEALSSLRPPIPGGRASEWRDGLRAYLASAGVDVRSTG